MFNALDGVSYWVLAIWAACLFAGIAWAISALRSFIVCLAACCFVAWVFSSYWIGFLILGVSLLAFVSLLSIWLATRAMQSGVRVVTNMNRPRSRIVTANMNGVQP